jgi:hypothetical protein
MSLALSGAETRVGEGLPRWKSKGCPQKTSGRSYSLKHPVARHFVWPLLVQVVCRPQAVQNTRRRVVPPCRNCAARGKIYFSGRCPENAQRSRRSLPRIFTGPTDRAAAFRDRYKLPFSRNGTSAIIGHSFFHSPHRNAPLAQLDRASGYEPEGREFESLRAHHTLH